MFKHERTKLINSDSRALVTKKVSNQTLTLHYFQDGCVWFSATKLGYPHVSVSIGIQKATRAQKRDTIAKLERMIEIALEEPC